MRSTIEGSRTISQRELRNQSAAIMDSLQAGQCFTVTRDGHPVGELLPLRGPKQGVRSSDLLNAFANVPHLDYHQLLSDLDSFFGDDDALI